jgi:hypothetical protein
MVGRDRVQVKREVSAERASSQPEREPGHDGSARLGPGGTRRLTAAAALQLQRTAGNRSTTRASSRSRDPQVATVLPADHPGERAADRLADAALASTGPRAPAALTTARSRGGGRPLGPAVRTAMEGAFGADFAAVRVHDDARADGMSRSIGALAFTSGPDIYFRGGAPDPGGPGGRRLLAHELAHVVQQARAPSPAPVIQRYTLVDSEDDVEKVQWSDDNTFVHQARGAKDFLVDTDQDTANIVEHDGAAGVSLKVSENYKLAVESVDGDTKQAKAYYSTREQIEASNNQLTATESAFVMVPQDGETVTLTTPEDGKVQLLKVLPRNLATPKGNERSPTPENTTVTEGLGMFSRQQCIELAQAVTGQTTGVRKDSYLKLADTTNEQLRGLLESVNVIGTGKLNAGDKAVTLRNFIEELARIAEATQAAVPLLEQLRPLFTELQGCLANDAEPSQELQTMLREYADAERYEEIPALSKVEVLASEELGTARMIEDVFKIVRQYVAYRALKRVEQSDDRDDVLEASGLNEYASPEVGEAYQVKYLQRINGDWNYHWAGVVARDGEDSVTLENFTRDERVVSGRFHDARWYFEMYGTGDQSFHTAYTRLGHGMTMTGVYATRPHQDSQQTPLAPAVAQARGFAGRLAAIRRTLISDSGARTNEHYLAIVQLLGECASLAIDGSGDLEQYKALVDRADQISAKFDDAISTKWFKSDDRNNALNAMWRDLIPLKKEVFRVSLGLR